MIKELLAKVSAKQDLTFDEAKQAIDEIMSGEVSEAEEEIAGAATGMRSKAMEFNIGGHALDIVGTGGDKSNSFNISTTSLSLCPSSISSRTILAGRIPHITPQGRFICLIFSAA